MKKLAYSTFFILFASAIIWADSKKEYSPQEFVKDISQSFNINSNADVSIENQYGNIEVHVGSANRVEFKISIVVTADKQAEADELFKRVNVVFDADATDVSAETEISSDKSWWNNFWKSKKVEYQVNYDVTLPNTVNLSVSNKYGNATIESMKNDMEIDLKYGNLNLSDVAGELDLDLAYGNMSAGDIGAMDVNVQYSDRFSVNSCRELDITSKYSKIFIEKVNDLDSETKYDEYVLGEVGNMDNNGKYDEFQIKSVQSIDLENTYSKVVIDLLGHDGDFTLKSGTLAIKGVSSGLSEIDIESSHTDVELNLSNISYTLDVESRHANVNLPSGLRVDDQEKDGNEFYVEGVVGNSPGETMISIDARYGKIRVR